MALQLMRDNIKKDGVDVNNSSMCDPAGTIEYIHGQLKVARDAIKTQCKS